MTLEYHQFESNPDLSVRIAYKLVPKTSKISICGYAVFSGSNKRVPGTQEINRTTNKKRKEVLVETICSLIETQYNEHTKLVSIPATELKNDAEETSPKEKRGPFSEAYYALPDCEIIFNSFGWAHSTIQGTKTYFENRVLPRIDYYGWDITPSNIKSIINELVELARKNKRGGHSPEKARETVSSVLGRIDRCLGKLYLISPVKLPQVAFGFHAPSAPKTEQAKALPPSIRIRLAACLRQCKGDPRATGVAAMFLLGLRTSEACSIRIKELVLDTRRFATYFVASQIVKGFRVNIPKTSAGYRYTIGGALAHMLFRARIEALLTQGFSMEKVLEMPLVGETDNPEIFLNPSTLSAYAKELLLACGYTEESLYAAEVLMAQDPDVIDMGDGNFEVETSVSCYILRRDFITRAFSNGLFQDEIDKLVGHKNRKLVSETAFNDPDVQFSIAKKLDNCVLLPDCTLHPYYNSLSISDHLDLRGSTMYCLKNNFTEPKQIRIRFKPIEGGEKACLITQGKITGFTVESDKLDHIEERNRRPIVLPPYSKEMLEHEISIACELNLTAFGGGPGTLPITTVPKIAIDTSGDPECEDTAICTDEKYDTETYCNKEDITDIEGTEPTQNDENTESIEDTEDANDTKGTGETETETEAVQLSLFT